MLTKKKIQEMRREALRRGDGAECARLKKIAILHGFEKPNKSHKWRRDIDNRRNEKPNILWNDRMWVQ